MVKFFIFLIFTICCLTEDVQSAPLVQNKTEEHPTATEKPHEKPEIDLPYGKYIQEVMKYLEEDPSFKTYLETAKEEDIANGRMANQLQFVNHHIRNKLDEVKREELNRLKTYARRMHEISNGVYSDDEMDKIGMDRSALSRPLHVDTRNPHTFEIEDLMQLIKKTTDDLEATNLKRRDEFKEYEMAKEWERRQKLQQMDEEHRKQAEKEYDEQVKKQKSHPKLHHPGSRQQLEEVWEKDDHLPVNEFNPEVMFNMHDLDGDGTWSEQELESMFLAELKKAYQSGADMRERNEEMNRMREHVMNETDTNRDGMINKEEFMAMVNKRDFNEDPGWEGLDEQQIYNSREFEEYQRQHPQAGYNPPPPVYMPQGGPPGSQYQYGQHPNGYPMGGQPAYPPVQGNDLGQFQQPYGNQQFQGNQHQQFQQQQYQQGVPQQQQHYQQGIPQQQQYYPGNQQQQQYHPGNQQQQFQHGNQQQQFQHGNQQPQVQHGNQPPQFQGNQQPVAQPGVQQPQFQQGNVQSQNQPGIKQDVGAQNQAAPETASSNKIPVQESTIKSQDSLNFQSQPPQQLNNVVR